MSTAYYFVEPLDTLAIRGNASFGGAGQHGTAVMPPWPSLFAGAFRSALLGGDGARLARFVALASDRTPDETERQTRLREILGDTLYDALGTPATPGAFRVSWLSLGLRPSPASGGGAGGEGSRVQPAIPLPADLVAFADTGPAALAPAALPAGCAASAELPLTPILRAATQSKPEAGRWLAGDAIHAHLAGQKPTATLTTDTLFKRETRLGIALDPGSRTAEDGALYTTEVVSFRNGAGFVVGLDGVADLLPDDGLLRLGGDGRGARYRRLNAFAAPAAAPVSKRFRLVLATPGLFSGGWLPERVTRQPDGSFRLHGDGFSARLASAAVARHDVVSGWDLASWQPKTAERVAPAGSVYWFDEFDGDAGKLAAWVAGGLWREDADPQRRAEGYNLAWLAAWPHS